MQIILKATIRNRWCSSISAPLKGGIGGSDVVVLDLLLCSILLSGFVH